MTKFKPWLLLAVIFTAGIVTGSALTIWLAPRFMHHTGAAQIKQVWLARLTRQLNLTPDQQTKIDPILTVADHHMQSLRRDEAEQIAQIIDDTNKQIAAILTPAQQAELQRMARDMQRNRDKMFPEHKRPWGPGGMGIPRGGPDGGMMPPPPPPPPLAPSTNAAPVQVL